jgi:hypothetical protein
MFYASCVRQSIVLGDPFFKLKVSWLKQIFLLCNKYGDQDLRIYSYAKFIDSEIKKILTVLNELIHCFPDKKFLTDQLKEYFL